MYYFISLLKPLLSFIVKQTYFSYIKSNYTHMLKIISFFCFLLLINSSKAQYDSIYFASLYRTFLLNVPLSYNPANKTPLVIAMHGGMGDANQLQYTSKLTGKSNTAGFILVYPEGAKHPTYGYRTWNGGDCCGYADTANIDDVGFISALIDSLRKDYNIDTNRIYATGISNGAIMSYRLACELSNRIAAIAPVAGTLEFTACNPQRPVPVIQFHSDLDSAIFIKGGLGFGVSGHSFKPVNYGLMVYDTVNACTFGPDSTYYTTGGSYYYKKRWYNCICNSQNILYVTGDGGHSWPMGRKAGYPGADTVSVVINANDSMWNFFQNNPLCSHYFSVHETEEIQHIEIYPNPVSNVLSYTTTPDNTVESVIIYNIYGSEVLRFIPAPTNTYEINCTFLRDGIYLASFKTAKSSIPVQYKLIKQ